MGSFLACDWGTTNLRAWRLGADGAVEAARDFPFGVSKLQPGQAEQVFRDQVRPALDAQALPALLCGMIGSNLGWRAVAYLDCPASAADLARGLVEVEGGPAPVRVVPGLRGPGLEGAPDVMRGEETQIIGWLALEPERLRGRHVVCHPGTHAKWALIEDGRIVRFLTAMTGELFEVLRRHSVLRTEARPDDEAAFDLGLKSAGDGGALASRLFTARSRVVAGGLAPDAAAAYLSGLLIGAEVAALPGLLGLEAGSTVAVVGEGALTRWYGRALEARGWRAGLYDGDQAVLSGLAALFRGLNR